MIMYPFLLSDSDGETERVSPPLRGCRHPGPFWGAAIEPLCRDGALLKRHLSGARSVRPPEAAEAVEARRLVAGQVPGLVGDSCVNTKS